MENGAAGGMATPPLILAVETSSRTGSVAIALGSETLGETRFSSPMRHSAEVFPAIRELLDRFGRKAVKIEQVYISVGPGSFTGLRIATAIAKTMYLANGARIVAVDTLDVIASNVISLTSTQTMIGDFRFSIFDLQSAIVNRIAAVLDAKRGQFFIAVYERQAVGGQAWKKVLPDSLMTAPQFLAQFAGGQDSIWLLGDGLVYYRDKFQADGIRFFDEMLWSPQARHVHLLGWEMALKEQFADPLALAPNYLRKPDVILKQR